VVLKLKSDDDDDDDDTVATSCGVFQLVDISTSTQLGQYCGSDVPNPVVAASNRLRIVFHSDGSHSGQGFLLRWEAVSSASVSPAPPNTTNPPGTLATAHLYGACSVVSSNRSWSLKPGPH